MNRVVTRFPPSPTGYFHIGSARTALFNYLFAKHHSGEMVLRLEDTDKERSKKEYEEDILQGLAWLGISYDREITRQSERTDIHRKHLAALIQNGHAYEAEESTTEAGKRVIRFKNPNTRITFSDLIRGDVSFDTTELKDFVIARSMDEPLYNFAVVVDDHDMGVTHIIRGEDHISNTQRQIVMLEALGFERPIYAHIPLILAPDKTKLSKRHGAASVNDYRRLGFEPAALLNYLALLGWTPPSGKEKLSREELIAQFDIHTVHKSGAVFDIEKLKWLNRQYILEASDERIQEEAARRIRQHDRSTIAKLIPFIRERISVWSDIDEMAKKGEFEYFFNEPKLDPQKIAGKGSDAAAAGKHLAALRMLMEALPSSGDIEPATVKQAIWEYAEKEGRGAVLWPFRYALTGREKSPDPFIVAAIIGRDAALSRIDAAIQALTTP